MADHEKPSALARIGARLRNLARYRKAVLAVAGATIVAGHAALTDEVITANEWFKIIAAFVTAASVYFVPNDEPAGTEPRPDLSTREPEPERYDDVEPYNPI